VQEICKKVNIFSKNCCGGRNGSGFVAALGQLLTQEFLERGKADKSPGRFNFIDESLIAGADSGKPLGVGRTGRGVKMAIVGIGAEEEGLRSVAGNGLDDEFHVGI